MCRARPNHCTGAGAGGFPGRVPPPRPRAPEGARLGPAGGRRGRAGAAPGGRAGSRVPGRGARRCAAASSPRRRASSGRWLRPRRWGRRGRACFRSSAAAGRVRGAAEALRANSCPYTAGRRPPRAARVLPAAAAPHF